MKVGSEDDLLADAAWLDEEIVFADGVSLPIEATVKVRARHGGAKATIERAADSDRVMVRFHEPVRAVSPGQVAVAYAGTRVLGGGVIREALRNP